MMQNFQVPKIWLVSHELYSYYGLYGCEMKINFLRPVCDVVRLNYESPTWIMNIEELLPHRFRLLTHIKSSMYANAYDTFRKYSLIWKTHFPMEGFVDFSTNVPVGHLARYFKRESLKKLIFSCSTFHSCQRSKI